MNLDKTEISPWIIEAIGGRYKLRKYFKTNKSLTKYFCENNQFISILDEFEELNNGYVAQINLLDYLETVNKFKSNHSKYSFEKRINKILKKKFN